MTTRDLSLRGRRDANHAREQMSLDWEHLDRQTMGDPALRAEVLSLFLHELAIFSSMLRGSPHEIGPPRIHAIRGAAAQIGANRLAELARRREEGNVSDDDDRRLLMEVDRVEGLVRDVLNGSPRGSGD